MFLGDGAGNVMRILRIADLAGPRDSAQGDFYGTYLMIIGCSYAFLGDGHWKCDAHFAYSRSRGTARSGPRRLLQD